MCVYLHGLSHCLVTKSSVEEGERGVGWIKLHGLGKVLYCPLIGLDQIFQGSSERGIEMYVNSRRAVSDNNNKLSFITVSVAT